MTTGETPYRRDVLVDTLVHHWPTESAGCLCGWAELGRSQPEHVADAYEARLAQSAQTEPDSERLEVRDRIAVAVLYNLPGDTPVPQARELIEGLTDITMDAISALLGGTVDTTRVT